MPRQMPKAGFYVRQKTIVTTIYGAVLPPTDCGILYTTGVRGGGGHKYYRQLSNSDPCILECLFEEFSTLTWTSVPGKKELEEEYHYASTLEEAKRTSKNFTL